MSLFRTNYCPHVHVRGIYGDEINHTPGHRRLVCQDCGQLLDGPVSIATDRQRIVDEQGGESDE